MEQAQQVCTPFISQIMRLKKGQRYLEVEQTVQMEDVERNLVTVYESSLDSGGVFWSDDSGMQMKERVWRNNSEELAGNFYPAVSTSFLVDEQRKLQLAFLTKSSHGVCSNANGQMEIMLHRRMDTNGFPPLGLCRNMLNFFFWDILLIHLDWFCRASQRHHCYQ